MSAVAIGVDVGGTKVLAVALADDGQVIDTERADTPHVPALDPGASTATTVLATVDALAARYGWSHEELVVGVGLPGMMSREGRLVFAPNLPSATGADIAGTLVERAPRLRVLCENDADCAVVAEHRLGAARGVDDVVMVTLGTGIGGGIITDGRLLRGRSGFAGEIGHMVVDANGLRCPCGSRGCWERYASGAGVARLAREAAAAGRLNAIVAARGDDESVRGEDVTHAAAAGDREALAVIEEVGWWLALGLANLAAVLDPALFILGGGLAEASALLLPPTRRHLVGLLEAGEQRPQIDVVAAELANHAGAVGAALLAAGR